ncbi:hypothetical protein [Chlorogloea sp. CCALA 695]|uniref:hypothetical protein n=1 Tax=Chlorogloea sp. CCALA 695 TaxID=2107693 RepID=UPI000D052C94|nr:hypothetical protein [Chlorogloea sp. CCALA 695]PSB30099.1 hypothetical protein C7B70_17025 [Chlorogloea sp. CCALA 695]
MFLPPNPLQENDDNRVNEATKGLGSFSREESMQLAYASFPGAGVFVFLDGRVSTVNAFIASLVTALGFYLLIKNAKQLSKKFTKK